MRILQINNMGSKLDVESAAVNQFLPLMNALPGTEIILIRDQTIKTIPSVMTLTLPQFFHKLPGFARSLFRLWQAMIAALRYQPDFVHGVHLWPQGLVAFLIAKLNRKPCVLSIVAGSREVHLFGSWMKRVALFCLNHSDAVIVTGRKTRQHLVDLGVCADKVAIIPNVIDVEHFCPNQSVDKPYHVVSTNRLYSVKNLGTFLRAVAIAKETIPELKVILGGTGPEMNTLQCESRDLGLQNTVVFLGRMDDVAQVLNKGRVFVLTSCSEGFPVTMVEAMACGLPCVVSNVGDVTDVAEHLVNSLVIEDCNDAEGFSLAMVSILTDPQLEKSLAMNSLKVRGSHSITSATSQWRFVLKALGFGLDV